MKKFLIILSLLSSLTAIAQTNKTILGSFSIGCRVFNYDFRKMPNGLFSFNIDDIDKDGNQVVFNKDSITILSTKLRDLVYSIHHLNLNGLDSVSKLDSVKSLTKEIKLVSNYQILFDKILTDSANQQFWNDNKNIIRSLIKISTPKNNFYLSDTLFKCFLNDSTLKNFNIKIEKIANSITEIKDSKTYTFNEFKQETFTPLCTHIIDQKKILFLPECAADTSVNNITLSIFYQIKAKLEFKDDQPVTAYLKLKNQKIKCFYSENAKIKSSKSNGHPFDNNFSIDNVSVEFEDGTIKNLLADVCLLDSVGNSIIKTPIRFKNTVPISISSRNDKDGFSNINIFSSDFGAIKELLNLKASAVKDELIYKINAENSTTKVVSNFKQTYQDRSIKHLKKIFKQAGHVYKEARENANEAADDYDEADAVLKVASVIGKSNNDTISLKSAAENKIAADAIAVDALYAYNTAAAALANAEGLKYENIYFVLSNLIEYDDVLEINKEDYSPVNTVVNLNLKYPFQELIKERRSRILTLKTFTDLVGIPGDQPNGLIQINASRKFNLWTKRTGKKNYYHGTLTYIEPSLEFSKIEKTNSTLVFSFKDMDPKILKDNSRKVFNTDAISILKYASSAFNVDVNILKFNLPNVKSNFQINVGAGMLRSNVTDSLMIDASNKVQQTSANDRILNTLRYGASAIYEIKPEDRYGFSVGYDLRVYKLLSDDYHLKTASHNIANSFWAQAYLKTNEQNMLFFRYKITYVSPAIRENFVQIQLGYLLDIFKTTSR